MIDPNNIREAYELVKTYARHTPVMSSPTIDALSGCTAVAMRRSAHFGRAPVIHDLTLAFTLWGFLDGAPADLAVTREPLFRAASHHYQVQRTIADCVPVTTLRLTPEQVAERLVDWRKLLELPADD